VPVDCGATPSSNISAIAYNNLKHCLGIADSAPATRIYDIIRFGDELGMDTGPFMSSRIYRDTVLKVGYLGYDSSVGRFNYSDEQVRENCLKSVARGFTALKLKVGSIDPDRDIRRANILRETAGDEATIMLDANQQWSLPQALEIRPLSCSNTFRTCATTSACGCRSATASIAFPKSRVPTAICARPSTCR
jgi:hypothetical protein